MPAMQTSGKRTSGRGNSKCKGPEAGAHEEERARRLMWPEHSERKISSYVFMCTQRFPEALPKLCRKSHEASPSWGAQRLDNRVSGKNHPKGAGGQPATSAEAGGEGGSCAHDFPGRVHVPWKGACVCATLAPQFPVWGPISLFFLGKSSPEPVPSQGSVTAFSLCRLQAWGCSSAGSWVARVGAAVAPAFSQQEATQGCWHTEAPLGFQKPLGKGSLWVSRCRVGIAGCVYFGTTGLLDQTLLCCGGLSWALPAASAAAPTMCSMPGVQPKYPQTGPMSLGRAKSPPAETHGLRASLCG